MHRMPLPSKKRALEAGAGFLEAELHRMRERAIAHDEEARRGESDGSYGKLYPLTTSLESDLMAVAEWAYAAARLRTMAENEV